MWTVLVLWATSCGDGTSGSGAVGSSGGTDASTSGGASAASIDPDTTAGASGTSGITPTGTETTGVDATGEASSSGTDTGAPLVPGAVLDLAAWKLTLPLGDPEARTSRGRSCSPRSRASSTTRTSRSHRAAACSSGQRSTE